MDARRTDRIWLVGGIITIVVLVTAAWLLVISPKFVEADGVQAEADDTTLQLTRLRKEVADLKDKNEKKATYQAELDTLVTNLPETWGMPVFLRSLQDSGTKTNVAVTDLSVGGAVTSVKVSSAITMPMSLNATGTVTDISRFIVRLQQTQSRAVLIDAVTVAGSGGADRVTANLTITGFCTTADLGDSAEADRRDLCAVS
ncbi:type 4a pilus biogenesis protein PilO [Actinoplanes solisilvae]|uniref:type 4a pilus biogenesis protein PilO n=1 Tax=Actinoplanes solisilvae TaxID=2486853 RepID=UPI000FDB812C|nr:type 4a pilus biogenesis protein PilO [Actinoplanes solisilvae]